MNIKNRIKKIEGKLKINDSPFCACSGSPFTEIVVEADGKQTVKNPIPEFCDACQKPTQKKVIIICGVDFKG